MKIPSFILRDIIDEITNKLEAIYNKYVYPSKKIQFKDYANDIIDETLKEIENLVEITNENLYPVKKRREMTKKRWFQKELEEGENSCFYQEIEVVAKGLYESLKDTEVEKFKIVYGYNSYEELKQAKIEEMKKWANDDDAPQSYFPFIKGKKPSQIEKAIYNDIKYIIIKTIKEKCPKGEQNAIYATPLSITQIPIDHSNKVKFNPSSLIRKSNDEYLIDIYYVDDHRVFESYLNIESLQEDLLQRGLKLLNATDMNVLLYVLSLRDEQFYLTREIIVEIGDIVRNVFGTDGKKNYRAVKSSLVKLENLELRATDSSLRNLKVTFFDRAYIYISSDTKKEVARIIVSQDILRQYVKNQTINIYKHIIDKFQLNSSKILITSLQRERIRCDAIRKENEPLIFRTNLNFFRGVLYMGKKRRKEQIQVIENALDEIVSNNITLKSYERNGDNFILEFYPFSEQERMDLLNNTSPEILLGEEELKTQIQEKSLISE